MGGYWNLTRVKGWKNKKSENDGIFQTPNQKYDNMSILEPINKDTVSLELRITSVAPKTGSTGWIEAVMLLPSCNNLIGLGVNWTTVETHFCVCLGEPCGLDLGYCVWNLISSFLALFLCFTYPSLRGKPLCCAHTLLPWCSFIGSS